MKFRVLVALAALGLLFGGGACNNHSTVANPVSPTTPSGSNSSISGTWTGTARDSSGSTLGTGSGGGTGMMTWQLTQNGNQVTGTMSMAGVQMMTSPTINGTMTGGSMSFTVSMPMGSMMTNCSDSASGVMTMNTSGNTMTGTYTGTNSCSGPYSNGQITLNKQ